MAISAIEEHYYLLAVANQRQVFVIILGILLLITAFAGREILFTVS